MLAYQTLNKKLEDENEYFQETISKLDNEK